MSTAQELLTLLEHEFPGSRYEQKPRENKPPARVETGLRTTEKTVPMCARIPPKRVELPALGGSITIEYEWDSEVER